MPSVSGSSRPINMIVDVRTSRGVLRPALLIPKAVLKALWEAEVPFREALGIKREREQLRKKQVKRGK